MRFGPQRRAIFGYRNIKKVVRTGQFFNILTCKRAPRYSGVQILRVRPSKSGPNPSSFFFCILMCKRAARHTGAQFFHIPTSKSRPNPSVFSHVELNMRFAPQRRAIFPLNRYLRTRRFTEPTFRFFDPAEPQIIAQSIAKTEHFGTFLTFRTSVSCFF